MKVSKIATVEQTKKRSFSFRASTVNQLEAYQSAYEEAFGVKVEMKDLVEQMLLDFMRDDKTFQAKLKTTRQPVKAGKSGGVTGNSQSEHAAGVHHDAGAAADGAAVAGGVD